MQKSNENGFLSFFFCRKHAYKKHCLKLAKKFGKPQKGKKQIFTFLAQQPKIKLKVKQVKSFLSTYKHPFPLASLSLFCPNVTSKYC